jgi:uncharacterized protein YcfJ
VLDFEQAERLAEAAGFVAGAVVGHDAGDGDAEAAIVAQRGEEGGGAAGLLVGYDLAEGDARSLAKAEREGVLREKIRFLCRCSLLVVDEIGYLPVTPGGGTCSSSSSTPATKRTR